VLPTCFGSFRKPELLPKCINCMVDVSCAGAVPALERKPPIYAPQEAVTRLVFSEEYSHRRISYVITRLYPFNLESAKTLLRPHRKFKQPVTEIDCYRLIYRHIIGRRVQRMLVDLDDPGMFDYFGSVFRTVELPPYQYGFELSPPSKARIAIATVNTIKTLVATCEKVKRFIVLKHMFKHREKPAFETRLVDLQQYFRVQSWRFAKAPIRFFILDKLCT
jgi:hypothetical protein